MKLMTVTITAFFLISTTWAQGQHRQNGRKSEHMQTVDDITMVVPALEKYAKGPLAELWKRPGLKPRDRSIVTIAPLIASNQTIEMPYYFNLALDNGGKPREISEIITHLAFTPAWGYADHADDAYCRSGKPQRKSRRLDGTSQRRTIPSREINEI